MSRSTRTHKSIAFMSTSKFDLIRSESTCRDS